MERKSLLTVVGLIAFLWLGSLAWLSGYKQGYSEGADSAWSDARAAFSEPIPLMHIDPVNFAAATEE